LVRDEKKRHAAEIYRLKRDMQNKFDNEMSAQTYEHSRLRDALSYAANEFKEQDRLIIEMEHTMVKSKRSTLLARKLSCKTDKALRILCQSPTQDDGITINSQTAGVISLPAVLASDPQSQ
jgi:hypothetical protein